MTYRHSAGPRNTRSQSAAQAAPPLTLGRLTLGWLTLGWLTLGWLSLGRRRRLGPARPGLGEDYGAIPPLDSPLPPVALVPAAATLGRSAVPATTIYFTLDANEVS